MIKKILKLINFLIPKKKQVCFFGPWNEKTGNNYLFLQFLKKYNPENIKYISISSDNIMTFNLENLKKIWNIFRSKIIVTTHGPLSVKSNNQILISFFHGILSKNGGLNDQDTGIIYYNSIDYQLTTSKLVSAIFSYNWCLHPKKYIFFGEPILEYLEELKNNTDKYINNIKEKKIKYKKIVLYAPTYRGELYNNYDINSILKDFINLVEKNKDIYFILSLHPLDKNKLNITNKEIINKLSNVELFEGDTIKILPFIDTLLTDASSIVYYGLYLKKEIIIFFPDYSEFIKGIDLFWKQLEIFDNKIIFTDEIDINKLSKLLYNYSNYNFNMDFIRKMFFYKDKYEDNKKIYNFILSLLNK